MSRSGGNGQTNYKEKRPVFKRTPGAFGFFYENGFLAAGRGIAAATAAATAATTAVIAADAQAVVAAAAPNDDQQDDDPAAVAATKTIIAHTGTSYENLDRPKRSQSIVCSR